MSRIDEIEARLKAATPGPWAVDIRNSGGSISDEDHFYGFDIQGPPEAMRGQFARGADADFVAHARTDVPALLALVKAYQRWEVAMEAAMSTNLESPNSIAVIEERMAAEAALDEAQAALDRGGEG